jgi:hypothetical protein
MANSTEWCTYSEQLLSIATTPIFEYLLPTLFIHARSPEWCTYFEQFAAIAPIPI